MTFFRNFQSFETNQGVDPNPPNYGNAAYSGSFYDPTAYAAPDPVYDATTSDFDNEPPLLEGRQSPELLILTFGQFHTNHCLLSLFLQSSGSIQIIFFKK